jgi:uncharacterized membrane protein YeiH
MNLEELASFPNLDLFAAGVNALNGALVAMGPKHNRGYTVAGVLIMAFLGGIGGGVSRDLLLDQVPSSLREPQFLVACILMGGLGIVIHRISTERGELFRTRTLATCKSFTLPWFAILGAHRAMEHELGFVAAVLIGLIATSAGGVAIDLFSGLTPELVRPSEHMVTAAILSGSLYVQLSMAGLVFPYAAMGAAVVGFAFRMAATHRHWRQLTADGAAQERADSR